MQNDDNFEARLKALSPALRNVDAIGAAYAAGRRSCQFSLNSWRGVAVVAMVAAVVPWMIPDRQRTTASPQLAIAARTDESPLRAVPVQPAPAGNMWQLQAAVLANGLEGLRGAPLPNTPVPRVVRPLDIF